MRSQVRRKLPKTNAEFAEKLQKIVESTKVRQNVASPALVVYLQCM